MMKNVALLTGFNAILLIRWHWLTFGPPCFCTQPVVKCVEDGVDTAKCRQRWITELMSCWSTSWPPCVGRDAKQTQSTAPPLLPPRQQLSWCRRRVWMTRVQWPTSQRPLVKTLQTPAASEAPPSCSKDCSPNRSRQRQSLAKSSSNNFDCSMSLDFSSYRSIYFCQPFL